MRSDVQFKSITIGQCHNALLTSTHQLWCWGGEIGSLCKRLYVDRCAHCKSGGGEHEVLRCKCCWSYGERCRDVCVYVVLRQ